MTVLKVHATSGLSAISRLVNTLKRKQVNVQHLLMEESKSNEYRLLITLDEDEERIKKAISYIKKLEEVYALEIL